MQSSSLNLILRCSFTFVDSQNHLFSYLSTTTAPGGELWTSFHECGHCVTLNPLDHHLENLDVLTRCQCDHIDWLMFQPLWISLTLFRNIWKHELEFLFASCWNVVVVYIFLCKCASSHSILKHMRGRLWGRYHMAKGGVGMYYNATWHLDWQCWFYLACIFWRMEHWLSWLYFPWGLNNLHLYLLIKEGDTLGPSYTFAENTLTLVRHQPAVRPYVAAFSSAHTGITRIGSCCSTAGPFLMGRWVTWEKLNSWPSARSKKRASSNQLSIDIFMLIKIVLPRSFRPIHTNSYTQVT